MKRFGKWLAKRAGTALTLVLVIVLLPYATRIVRSILPEPGGTAIEASIILSEKLQDSARLETEIRDISGVFNSKLNALFLGTVQDVTISYDYHASVGIDLAKISYRVINDHLLELQLPMPEVLSDSLSPSSTAKHDFWYPLTESRRDRLIEAEKLSRRQEILTEIADSEDFWERTERALNGTVAQWLSAFGGGLQLRYALPSVPGQAPEGTAQPT